MPKNANISPDYIDPASLTPRAGSPQLSIGQEVPEVSPPPAETPPGLRLSEKEQARVDRLKEQGYDEATALVWAAAKSTARRIIGHHYAEAQVSKHAADAEARRAREHKPAVPVDEIVDLLRETDPKSIGKKPTDKAA